MKRILSKTIKLKRLTVRIVSNELSVIYIGEKKIFIKTFRLRIPRDFALKALACAMVLMVMVLTAVRSGDKAAPASDNEKKEQLLKSSATDYSNPDKYVTLALTEHVVREGENLNSIAKKYGISIDTICGSNSLTSYDLINTGVVLKIPNKEGILYRVKVGDRVSSLSARYRIPTEKILAENVIRNPDFLPANSTIFIPDAKPQDIIIGFMWPTAWRQITCGYGWRRNPWNPRYSEFHGGLDIRASYEYIRASKYGQVTYTGWLGEYGRTVIIAHPGGWKTLYSHLSHIIVRNGQYVKQGQYIAQSGSTGRSTGPHLHFEIIRWGNHLNPFTYLAR